MPSNRREYEQVPVTLINAFEVPAGDERMFLEQWRRTSEQAEAKPGFIETKLHRSLRDDARFLYVNVAVWESEDAYHAAFESVSVREGELPNVHANPALYKVVVQA